jgi:hypothetical protein
MQKIGFSTYSLFSTWERDQFLSAVFQCFFEIPKFAHLDTICDTFATLDDDGVGSSPSSSCAELVCGFAAGRAQWALTPQRLSFL